VIADGLHFAAHNCLYTELAPGFLRVTALESVHRIPSNDSLETANLRNRIDQSLGQAFTQVIQIIVAGIAREGQNRNGIQAFGDAASILHGYKSIANPGHRFDIAAVLSAPRRLSQNNSQFADCGVQPVIEVDELIRGPNLRLQLISRQHLAPMLQERYQQPKDLVLQLHRPVISAKFAGAKVYLIPTEPDNASNLRHVFSPGSHDYATETPQANIYRIFC
jgi:hypothetical protein